MSFENPNGFVQEQEKDEILEVGKKFDSFLARNRIFDENLDQFVACLEIQFLDHMSSLHLLQKVTIRAPKNKHKKLAPLDSDCDRYCLRERCKKKKIEKKPNKC